MQPINLELFDSIKQQRETTNQEGKEKEAKEDVETGNYREISSWSSFKDIVQKCDGLVYQPLWKYKCTSGYQCFASTSFPTLQSTGCFDVASIIESFDSRILNVLPTYFLQDLIIRINEKIIEGRNHRVDEFKQYNRFYRYMWNNPKSIHWMIWIFIQCVSFFGTIIMSIVSVPFSILLLGAAIYLISTLFYQHCILSLKYLPKTLDVVNLELDSSIHMSRVKICQDTIESSPSSLVFCCKRKQNPKTNNENDQTPMFKHWFKMLVDINPIDSDDIFDLKSNDLIMNFRFGVACLSPVSNIPPLSTMSSTLVA